MKEDLKVYTLEEQKEALPKSYGTSLVGYLRDVTYSQLVSALGDPTCPFASGDDKVQKEWICEFKGKIYTIYDYRTYSEADTMVHYKDWHIGSKSGNYFDPPTDSLKEFIEHIDFLVHFEDTKDDLGLKTLEN
tara:strand:+ start:65 stop:463 length:399 start_codon:yes stop_codon:yes gene_type:complete